jgi:prepilin-type N-terminal cleavage/methylation domain-containing protein
MRKGFTLIELMIVIAIIAIIAAIAIPNLLESRITANEANAATSLKSGIFPGQTQFQAGGYIDIDGDGLGTFAPHVAAMGGGVGAGTALNLGPTKSLTLLDPKYGNQQGTTSHQSVTFTSLPIGAITAPTGAARVGAYDYYMHTVTTADTAPSSTNEDSAETYFGATTIPVKNDGSEARRAFGMNAAGSIFQTKQTLTNAEAALVGTVGATGAATPALGTKSLYASNPATTLCLVNSTNAAPYQK